MKSTKNLFITCFTFATLINLSCNANSLVENSLQEKYKLDTDYFIGLKALQNKDTKTALRHFEKSISYGSKYVSRRSMEQKIKLGNIQQQIAGAKEYLSFYNDDAALIFACKIFFDNQEYATLLDVTNSIDFSECPNELAKMRLLSMHEKRDSRLNEATCKWFTCRTISSDHITFYYENLFNENSYNQNFSSSDFTEQNLTDNNLSEENLEENLTDQNLPIQNSFDQNFSDNNLPLLNFANSFVQDLMTVIKFRITCAEKNFSTAYEMIDKIQELCMTKKTIPLTAPIICDIGKIYFSNSKKDLQNGEYFLRIASSEFALTPQVKYFSYLYAARIFAKSNYISKSEDAYINSMNCAKTPEDYDMALWFFLNSKLAISTDKCIEGIKKYCSTWNNPYYFSDILDNLSLLLFTSANWEAFDVLYKTLDGYADNASTAKFAYITGQLINKKFLFRSDSEKTDAFTKAYELNAGTDVYYRLLAAKQLGISKSEIERKIFSSTTAESAKNDSEAEKLLAGYADFGFSELIYPEWLYFNTLNNNIFGLDTICYVSNFLRSCGNSTNNNYYKSLRMIFKTANLDNSKLNRNIFELSYPKNFSKEIENACKEFGVEEYAMLGLIRTESFFNPVVESHAGALGLSQLMESTFEDCVKKLKLENADITDPATNIKVGTYYYSSLVSRLDNSDILALFAYNAGISRVRRWLNASKVGLGLYKNLPSDLFLETIPISETRNYGRKVIQSAAIYGWLYYGKNPCDIIDEMM